MGALRRLFLLIHWCAFIIAVPGFLMFGYVALNHGIELFFTEIDDSEIQMVLFLCSGTIIISVVRWILFNELIWLPWKSKKNDSK